MADEDRVNIIVIILFTFIGIMIWCWERVLDFVDKMRKKWKR